MLIKTIENKIKLATTVTIAGLIAAVLMVAIVTITSYLNSVNARKTIYVLNGDIPLQATQSDVTTNIEIEAKAHIEQFHRLFFTLPADEKYIEKTIEKSMYLIDESGMRQYNMLKEKGFYNSVLSSSANITIMADSIIFEPKSMGFVYYGVQRIERPTSILKRQLITSGYIQQTSRTENNPHGLLIVDWKTELNKDISYTTKRNF